MSELRKIIVNATTEMLDEPGEHGIYKTARFYDRLEQEVTDYFKPKGCFVILESPFAGDMERNRKYAILCLRDSLLRGESPFASHILYTEALDDLKPWERDLGITAGLEIGKCASKTVVYTDLGISRGMHYGIICAKELGRPIEYRSIKKVLR